MDRHGLEEVAVGVARVDHGAQAHVGVGLHHRRPVVLEGGHAQPRHVHHRGGGAIRPLLHRDRHREDVSLLRHRVIHLRAIAAFPLEDAPLVFGVLEDQVLVEDLTLQEVIHLVEDLLLADAAGDEDDARTDGHAIDRHDPAVAGRLRGDQLDGPPQTCVLVKELRQTVGVGTGFRLAVSVARVQVRFLQELLPRERFRLSVEERGSRTGGLSRVDVIDDPGVEGLPVEEDLRLDRRGDVSLGVEAPLQRSRAFFELLRLENGAFRKRDRPAHLLSRDGDAVVELQRVDSEGAEEVDGHRDSAGHRFRLDPHVGVASGREEVADRGPRLLLGQRLARLDRDQPADFFRVDRTVRGVRDRHDGLSVERRRLRRLLAGCPGRRGEQNENRQRSSRDQPAPLLADPVMPQNRCRRLTLIE